MTFHLLQLNRSSLTAALFLFGQIAFGQVTSAGFDTHGLVNARQTGVADAIITAPDNPGSLYWNPSALGLSEGISGSATFGIEDGIGGARFEAVSGAMSYDFGTRWVFGFGGSTVKLLRLPSAESDDAPSLSAGGGDFAVARKVSRSVCIGFAAHVRVAYSSGSSYNSLAGSIGVVYSPSPQIAYAFAWRGFGSVLEYPLVGALMDVPIRTSRVPGSILMSISTQYPRSGENQILLVGVAGEKSLDQREDVVVSIGAELHPLKFLSLRMGYWQGPNSSVLKFGGGIRLGVIAIDYANSLSRREPRVYQMSLSYHVD